MAKTQGSLMQYHFSLLSKTGSGIKIPFGKLDTTANPVEFLELLQTEYPNHVVTKIKVHTREHVNNKFTEWQPVLEETNPEPKSLALKSQAIGLMPTE